MIAHHLDLRDTTIQRCQKNWGKHTVHILPEHTENIIYGGYRLIGIELFSAMSSDSTWALITSEDVLGDMQDNGRILTVLKHATGNCSMGMTLPLIEASLWCDPWYPYTTVVRRLFYAPLCFPSFDVTLRLDFSRTMSGFIVQSFFQWLSSCWSNTSRPAKSPDLFPEEHVFGLVSRHFRSFQDRVDIIWQIEKVWQEIHLKNIYEIYLSIPAG